MNEITSHLINSEHVSTSKSEQWSFFRMDQEIRQISEFSESDTSLKYWVQFKDLFFYRYLSGAVVATWSLTQKVVCSNNLYKYVFLCH